MTVKEYVTQLLESLSEAELRQVAEYLSFLKFRLRASAMPHPDSAQMAALYAEFADEDRAMSEEGIQDYGAGLSKEDAK